ncbi:hypothetical protein, partial [Mesotoga prima]|uniref:hypothetical protein n=1 Tax=Mesotoga prima TaxID=1184387 RepID=UPI002C6DBA5E
MNQAYEFFEALASGNLTRILFILFVQILAIIIVGLRHEVWRWLINRRVLFKIILSLFISVVTTLLFKRSLVLSLLGYSSAAVIAVIGVIFS